MRDIFASAAHFVNLQERNRRGLTPFLEACRTATVYYDGACNRFESRRNIDVLGLFLKNGASVQERGHDGTTCLHAFFTGSVDPPSQQDWHDSLNFLIDKGADVYAEDNFGWSVSHVAYSRSCRDEEPWSYRGDLWDAVLDASGFDIREFRKGYPRKAKYTLEYTYSDFRALWKGREGRCPYWDDEPWFSPLDDERIEDKAESLCHCSRLPPGECMMDQADGSVDDFSEMELDSRQVQEVEDDDDHEEEEAEEVKDDQEGGQSSEKGSEDQEDHVDWTWEPSSPSREWVLEGDPFPAFFDAEPERPYALSHGAREATGLGDGAAQTSSWSSTTLYGSILSNPWLDD